MVQGCCQAKEREALLEIPQKTQVTAPKGFLGMPPFVCVMHLSPFNGIQNYRRPLPYSGRAPHSPTDPLTRRSHLGHVNEWQHPEDDSERCPVHSQSTPPTWRAGTLSVMDVALGFATHHTALPWGQVSGLYWSMMPSHGAGYVGTNLPIHSTCRKALKKSRLFSS